MHIELKLEYFIQIELQQFQPDSVINLSPQTGVQITWY